MVAALISTVCLFEHFVLLVIVLFPNHCVKQTMLNCNRWFVNPCQNTPTPHSVFVAGTINVLVTVNTVLEASDRRNKCSELRTSGS